MLPEVDPKSKLGSRKELTVSWSIYQALERRVSFWDSLVAPITHLYVSPVISSRMDRTTDMEGKCANVRLVAHFQQTQLNVIDVYDIAGSTWYKQGTSGTTPPFRVNACAVVAAAAE